MNVLEGSCRIVDLFKSAVIAYEELMQRRVGRAGARERHVILAL